MSLNIKADIIIEPVTAAQARLDFGDFFAYALAKDKAEPLLFKDDDFAHADVKAA